MVKHPRQRLPLLVAGLGIGALLQPGVDLVQQREIRFEVDALVVQFAERQRGVIKLDLVVVEQPEGRDVRIHAPDMAPPAGRRYPRPRGIGYAQIVA
jgi:hypothetical protein